ncbi:MAG: hypothetical protein VB108_08130 [Anaerolineaceae bacterium]|nr:hypothetical protein [Anaerolineaceae bacterium]
MKVKRYCIPVICVLLTSMLCILTACNASSQIPAQVVEQNKNSEPEQAQTTPEQVQATVVNFTDSALETIVRASIGKPSGDITVDDVKTVTRLDLSNKYQHYISDETVIKDINGLEYFTSLEMLDLSSHLVSDITPSQRAS